MSRLSDKGSFTKASYVCNQTPLFTVQSYLTKGFLNVKSQLDDVNGITTEGLPVCSGVSFEVLKCAGVPDFDQGSYGQEVNTLLLYHHVFEIGITN